MQRAAAIILVSAGLFFQPQKAIADPPPGTDLNSTISNWYHSLKNAKGEQCCGPADCRGVQIRFKELGVEAFIDKRTFGPTAPDDWVQPAAPALINREDNPTGRSVGCWYNGELRCLTLNTGG